ncbi:glycerophosphodiester phosphodiesterase [Nocardioidaceae bacterium]|nr:glycerophosphodiester phosphodiesterase [Nocardioidaceae bacterium]
MPPPSQPQIVAHRGDSATEAEHTLGAYVRALEAGAEAVECDVRLTADGHLVCAHDRDLRRTASHRGVISTMTLEELDAIDVASWKNPWRDFDDEAEERDRSWDTVLPLRTLLETIASQPRRIEVAIETKHPTRYAGLVEKRVVDLLREFGWHTGERARVLSFSWVALTRVRRQEPRIPIVYCMDKRRTWVLAQGVDDRGWIAAPDIKLLRRDASLRDACRTGARRMHVWTVNELADLEWCASLGVEAVITDKPGDMLRGRDSLPSG